MNEKSESLASVLTHECLQPQFTQHEGDGLCHIVHRPSAASYSRFSQALRPAGRTRDYRVEYVSWAIVPRRRNDRAFPTELVGLGILWAA